MDDPVVFLKRETGWLGADVCIDAVGCDAAGNIVQSLIGRKLPLTGGAATALHWAINSVKKGGVVSIVGVYGPLDALVPIGNVVNKGITIRANQASVKRLLSFVLLVMYSYLNCFYLISRFYLQKKYLWYLLLSMVRLFVVIKLPQFIEPQNFN